MRLHRLQDKLQNLQTSLARCERHIVCAEYRDDVVYDWRAAAWQVLQQHEARVRQQRQLAQHCKHGCNALCGLCRCSFDVGRKNTHEAAAKGNDVMIRLHGDANPAVGAACF